MDWFRSHHGAPSDSKWLVIARKSNVQPVAVVAVFWSLLDYASQQESRGDIEGFDPESVAAFLGIEDDEITAIMTAFEDKGITENGRIANWDKRQPKREREDSSAARVQRHRETRATISSDVTPCNATVTPCNATVTPCNAMQRQETPREEERRGDYIRPPLREEEEVQTTTQGKFYDASLPLPLEVQNFISVQDDPERWERELLLELAGRPLTGKPGSYMMSLLRSWKRSGLPDPKTAQQRPSLYAPKPTMADKFKDLERRHGEKLIQDLADIEYGVPL